jgi:uncharacterized protein
MGKLLVLLIAVLVLFLLWKGLRRGARSDKAGTPSDGERMVNCSECGLHLPISEAVQSQGRYFCSEEHRRLFSR